MWCMPMMWEVTLGAHRWRRCHKRVRRTIACGVINNKIYVAGGSDVANVRNNLYIYDIATNSWTSGPPMLVAADLPGWRGRGRQTLGIGGALIRSVGVLSTVFKSMIR